MGPGCFYAGNTTKGDVYTYSPTLHWGRDVSIPEIKPFTIQDVKIGQLQWGRDVSMPEIPPRATFTPTPRRFTGAGMFLSRKLNRSRFRTSRSGSFNGAGMFLCRKYHQGRRLHLLHDASMGPGCFRSEERRVG